MLHAPDPDVDPPPLPGVRLDAVEHFLMQRLHGGEPDRGPPPPEEIRERRGMLDRLHHIGQGTIPDGFLPKEELLYIRTTKRVPLDRVGAPCVERPCALPHASGDGIERCAGE